MTRCTPNQQLLYGHTAINDGIRPGYGFALYKTENLFRHVLNGRQSLQRRPILNLLNTLGRELQTPVLAGLLSLLAIENRYGMAGAGEDKPSALNPERRS